MKVKYEEGKLIGLSKLRPGECFCLLDSAGVMEPEVYLVTDFPDRSLAIEYATANNLDFEEVEGGIADEN